MAQKESAAGETWQTEKPGLALYCGGQKQNLDCALTNGGASMNAGGWERPHQWAINLSKASEVGE